MLTAPLHRYPVFESTSLDHTRAMLHRHIHDHPIEANGLSDTVDAVLNGRKIQQMGVSYLAFGADVVTRPGVLEYYLLQYVVSGTYGVGLAGRSHTLTRGEAAIISPFEDLQTWWSADCGVLTYRIDFSQFHGHLADAAGVAPAEPLRFEPYVDEQGRGVGDLKRKLLLPLADQLNRYDGLLDDPERAYQVEQLLMSTLIEVQPHNYSDQLRARG